MNIKSVSRTVYSLFYPEVQTVIENVLKDCSSYQTDYQNAHTKKQDTMHLNFINKYKEWSKGYLNINWEDFANIYPCNGSSEAIREQLAHLKAIGVENLYVFNQEYEGYEAIARTVNLNIIKFKREKYREIKFKEKSTLFISQPSSIDGNIWEEYDLFMNYMLDNYAYVSIYLDLAYLGTVDKDYSINSNYSNIKGVFFSLSKIFGVYYHRIGGCVLKEQNPLLYGNMWFKNLLSMRIGIELMNNFDIRFLPRTYKKIQENAIEKIKNEFSIDDLNPSDVILLSNFKNKYSSDHELTKWLTRGDDINIRACLTPLMEKMIRENR